MVVLGPFDKTKWTAAHRMSSQILAVECACGRRNNLAGTIRQSGQERRRRRLEPERHGSRVGYQDVLDLAQLRTCLRRVSRVEEPVETLLDSRRVARSPVMERDAITQREDVGSLVWR